VDVRWLPTAAVASWLAAHQPQGAPPDPPRPPPIRPLRYDEDYAYLRDPAARFDDAAALESIKYIPLDSAGDWYVSFGGELRQEYEFYDNRSLGASTHDDDGGYLLQRYVLHADAHAAERLRFFGQLYAAPTAAEDLEPSRADADDLRLQQAFADVLLYARSSTLTLRAGRQELLYGSERLVSVREGLNVRRSFDAIRLIGNVGAWRVDGFLSRPVEVDPRALNDSGADGVTFWGVYATRAFDAMQVAACDVYYLGLRNEHAAFSQGADEEIRHTLGSRLFGTRGAWDYDLEAMLQIGTFGAGDIRAWSAAGAFGHTLESTPLRPRLGLKVSVISGDEDPDDADLGTFDALFPKGNYFGESVLIGPANLFNVHPSGRVELSRTVDLEAGWDLYWRYSEDDAIYGPAGTIVQAPNGSAERYVGSESSVLLNWRSSRELSLRVGYSRFFAGAFMNDAGTGTDLSYFSLTLAYRF
jgi:hypothetical protein